MEVKKKCVENNENMEKFHNLHKSRKILLEMLQKCNYNIEEYQYFSVSELQHMLNNNQLDMLLHNKMYDKSIYIKYFEFDSNKILNKNILMDMYEDLFEIEKILKKDDILIIVYNCDPNESCKTQLKHIWESKGYLISVVALERLQYNILEHTLVPHHEIIIKDERKDFIEKYGTNIPEISRFDPVAVIIGMRPNDICKIKRPSKNSIESNYYRICVNK